MGRWRGSSARRRRVLLVASLVSVIAVSCTSRDVKPSATAPTSSTTAITGPTSASTPPITTTEASTTADVTTATATTTTLDGASSSARAAVDRLEVRTADEPGVAPYRRDAFGSGWNYDSATGCNTRERVLIEESLIEPTLDDRCHPTAGRWRSSYDGVITADPDDLQIDHVVALADAWRSGAASWSDVQRRAFANDLSDPNVLAAVTGRTNQSKGDSTPDAWLPPDRASWCAYATAWVEVKAHWKLSVAPAEKAALVQVLSGC